jgi:hypothetical protein
MAQGAVYSPGTRLAEALLGILASRLETELADTPGAMNIRDVP